METVEFDGRTISLTPNTTTMVHRDDWVIQVSPEDAGVFEAVLDLDKDFCLNLEGDAPAKMRGRVILITPHTFNKGIEQIQVHVRRTVY